MDTAALVDRMVDCFHRHDLEGPAACYAPDARVHPRTLAANHWAALLETRLTGTNTGPYPLSETERLLLGTQAEILPATGRATDVTGVIVLEVADGRVTAERHYWPLADGLVQLGLIGPPEHAVDRHPAREALHEEDSGIVLD